MAKKIDHEELLSVARKRMELAISAFSESRDNELDDLRFFAGDPDNQWQWPPDVLQTRGAVQGQSINARPCLTINKLPQHVRQVTNDIRQNRPAGKIIPVDDKGDVEVAEIIGGIVRHIEQASDADVAIDTAVECMTTHGEGYFGILTDYIDDQSFDQDIIYRRIRNPFSVYMDPTIQDPTGADAEWVMVTQDMLHEEFERMFPEAKALSSLKSEAVGDTGFAAWVADKTVRIAEYWYTEYKTETLNLYPGGMTAFAGSQEARQMEMLGVFPLRQRPAQRKRIKFCKHNGYEVLEEKEWAGKWIPIVRVVGNEFEVEGRVYLSGLVRNAKDAQRLYNYWTSQEAEMLALAPKAPFVGYAGQFEGFENQWKTANINNWPYLEVNPDASDGQGNPLPLPQRAAPPLPQTGLIQAKMGAADDIKATTGQYDSALGAESNEKSGKAIIAREKQADTGTFHYVDNTARSVRHATRIIVDLIPKIYDTRRIARIIGLDGEPEQAKIDPRQEAAVREIKDQQTGVVVEKIYNPSVGKYDVVVTTGPGYQTKRQQALDAMAQLLQGNPQLWQVAGDLFIRNMDWPGAEEMAERFKRTIPAQLLGDKETSPELAQAQQAMQEMQQQMEMMRQMLTNVGKSIEAQELEVKKYEAETRRISAVQDRMSEDQVQDIVLGTIHSMITTGDLVGEMPERSMEGMEGMEGAGNTEGMEMEG